MDNLEVTENTQNSKKVFSKGTYSFIINFALPILAILQGFISFILVVVLSIDKSTAYRVLLLNSMIACVLINIALIGISIAMFFFTGKRAFSKFKSLTYTILICVYFALVIGLVIIAVQFNQEEIFPVYVVFFAIQLFCISTMVIDYFRIK